MISSVITDSNHRNLEIIPLNVMDEYGLPLETEMKYEIGLLFDNSLKWIPQILKLFSKEGSKPSFTLDFQSPKAQSLCEGLISEVNKRADRSKLMRLARCLKRQISLTKSRSRSPLPLCHDLLEQKRIKC